MFIVGAVKLLFVYLGPENEMSESDRNDFALVSEGLFFSVLAGFILLSYIAGFQPE